jgi:elongation factor 1-beta
MGKVAITYNIMPENPEVDLDAIRSDIYKNMPEGVEVKGTAVNPVAFGLNAIKVLIIVGDEPGIADEVEKRLAAISGVESVEAVDTDLV